MKQAFANSFNEMYWSFISIISHLQYEEKEGCDSRIEQEVSWVKGEKKERKINQSPSNKNGWRENQMSDSLCLVLEKNQRQTLYRLSCLQETIKI